MKKIIHIDMDAFYASVEQRDNTTLKGKPIAVGGNRERGVVAAASYEAREYGVFSAMPSKTAIKKCPHLIFVKPDFEKYKKISLQIRDIFNEYTNLVEPLSLDEAYLDVTENFKHNPSASNIAKEIKVRIKEETYLNASAGVSYNKFLAKIASDMDKPDGFFLIKPDQAISFLRKLDVKKFHGIGRKTAEKMHKMGIYKGSDLEKLERFELIKHFGKAGSFYYNIVRGVDNRAVNPNRERKSIGAEITFGTDIQNPSELMVKLHDVAERLFKRVQKNNQYGKTITIKIKFHDFEQITRSKTVNSKIQNYEEIVSLGEKLLFDERVKIKPIRLLGLSVTNFATNNNSEMEQLTFDFT